MSTTLTVEHENFKHTTSMLGRLQIIHLWASAAAQKQLKESLSDSQLRRPRRNTNSPLDAVDCGAGLSNRLFK